MQREIHELRTWQGRVIRDVWRKAVELQDALKTRMATAQRLHAERRDAKNKRHALHAPEVECIAKGKLRTPYEFGVMTSVAVKDKEGLVVGSDRYPARCATATRWKASLNRLPSRSVSCRRSPWPT